MVCKATAWLARAADDETQVVRHATDVGKKFDIFQGGIGVLAHDGFGPRALTRDERFENDVMLHVGEMQALKFLHRMVPVDRHGIGRSASFASTIRG